MFYYTVNYGNLSQSILNVSHRQLAKQLASIDSYGIFYFGGYTLYLIFLQEKSDDEVKSIVYHALTSKQKYFGHCHPCPWCTTPRKLLLVLPSNGEDIKMQVQSCLSREYPWVYMRGYLPWPSIFNCNRKRKCELMQT